TALLLVLLFVSPASSLATVRSADPIPSVLGTQYSALPVWHEPDANRLKFGIAGHMWWLDSHLNEFMAYYHQLGITNVRLSLDWKTLEPQPGQYDFAQFDRVLNRLAAENIEVIASFVAAPAWASPDSAACAKAQQEFDKERLTCGIRPDAEPQFRAAVRTVAARYPFIRLWEFWNEPELWSLMGHEVADYLRWLRPFYDEIHAVNPGAVVAANTLAGFFYVDWLYGVSDNTNGPSKRPWDAISFHPYGSIMKSGANGQVAAIIPGPIQDVRKRMVDAGDAGKKLWITEYGWETTPDQQAAFLQQGLPWLLSQDYIEVANLHMLHDWTGEHYGLLATEIPIYGTGRSIDASTKFVPKEPYYSAYKNFPKPVTGAAPNGPGILAFAQTGHAVQSELRAAWERLGGMTTLGLPRTAEYARRDPADGRWYRTQDFERGRLIVRPAESGRPARVDADLIANAVLQAKGWLDPKTGTASGPAAPEPAPTVPDAFWFPVAGHAVASPFRAAWQQAGGLAFLGMPRTGVITENSLAVQYFERGRLELHGDAVWFGSVGNDALAAQGWLDAGGGPIPNTPTAREWGDR
ncbi:MAG: beta-galactosidase, partial [Chloroflexota bacterium]|nr:beta-galactosidase [Chloroflexota bacterium]